MGAVEVRSAFLRKSGRRWTAVLKYSDGERVRQKTRALGQCTRSEAMRLLEAFRSEFERSGSSSPVPSYAEEYIASLDLEPSTRSVYSYMLSHLSELDVPLSDLTPSMVSAWERGMSASLSPSTVGKAHRLLKQVCRHAVDVGDLHANPCDQVRPPKRPRSNPNALGSDGRSKLLSILSGMEPSPFRTAVYIALLTGMRRGEICALRWEDVDLGAMEIHVRRSVGIGKGGAYEKAPKTLSSTRVVPIPDMLSEVLSEPHRGEYVLGDAPYSPSRLTKEWQSFARSFGISGNEGPCTFHDLRHTYATVAISNGADVRSVASILGHSSAAMTLDVYASADEEAMRRAASIVGEAISSHNQGRT